MEFKEAESKISAWLDSAGADTGLTFAARHQLDSALKDEDAYKFFAAAILSPPPSLDDEQRVKRSFRAMQVLTGDLAKSPDSAVLMNATRAGLLAKDIFAALNKGAYLLHARKLLDSLLGTYPSSVVSAACAGGKEGMESHLRPLLLAETSSQTLPTLTNLVVVGCTGKMGQPSAEQTQQAAYNILNTPSTISNGHRRKFVRTLSDWDVLSRIFECINDNFAMVGEELCESILTIVECLGTPESDAQSATNKNGVKQSTESVGEDMVLAALGKDEWWDPVFAQLNHSNETTKVAATRAMMGIITLATGSSSRIRKVDAPMTDATENFDGSKQNDTGKEIHEHKNKLLEWGLTAKIHRSLIGHIPQLCRILLWKEGADQGATTYWNRGDDQGKNGSNDQKNGLGIPHPGRCRIVPFSTWRLHLVTLLAEIVTYNDDTPKVNATRDPESLRHTAMSAVMKLPLSASLLPEGEEPKNDDVCNPWPSLCDWVFDYPENNLFHFQFIRLFRAIVLEHHEPTLRLVLQKAKFVSRSVRACKEGGPLRGVLIQCLNLLRLRSQSLPASAFLRQFLFSHDGWKAYQDSLLQITMTQRFGGKPVPGQEVMCIKNMSIDLGSKFSDELGFEGFESFVDEVPPAEASAAAGANKKKKKNRKKKNKNGDVTCDPGDEDDKD